MKSTRLGGGLSVFFGCDGCKVSFTKYEHGPARNNDISVCVQVAFIVAGCTHAVYCKTLQNALGMNTNETIGKMYPVVKAMVDDLCEVAKREMKEKNDGDLGSWKRAVTTAETRGWHSKNATFTIRTVHSCITTTSARRAGIRLLRVTSILVPLNQPRVMLHV